GRYLDECLTIETDGARRSLPPAFPDFDVRPPDFPLLLNQLAYFHVTYDVREADTLQWQDGERPDLVLKTATNTYVTLAPGDRFQLGAAGGRPRLLTTFVQGFLHVLPEGWDHVLFILGLF